MLITFDKDKLIRHGNSHCLKIVDILAYITYRPIPKNYRDGRLLKYQSIDWSGESFLLHPEELIDTWWRYKDIEVLQYIFVAARRKMADYIMYKKLTLDTTYVNTKVLENNRLLSITGENIHFKFEEK